MGYALWLITSPEEYATLEKFMEFRPPNSKVDETSKSYPCITPHITLASFDGLPSTLNIDDLPISGPKFKPPVLRYVSWKQGGSYLSALGLNLSQPKELKRLHTAITDYLGALGLQWRSRSFPHMSLFYIDEPEERVRLVEGFRNYLKEIGTSNDNGIPFTQFTGTEIWLVDCTKSVRKWWVMEKRKLSFFLEKALSEVSSDELSNTSKPEPHSEETEKQGTTTTKHRHKKHPSKTTTHVQPIQVDPTASSSVEAPGTTGILK